MVYQENQVQKDALPSTSTSGSGTGSETEGIDEMEASHQEHCSSPEKVHDSPSSSLALPGFFSYRHGKLLFQIGDWVCFSLRLPSHVTIEAVKVIPGLIQRIYDDELVLLARVGFLRVSKLAVMSHCRSWTPHLLDQMTVARTTGWTLEQFPLAKEVYPGSLHEDRSDSQQLPRSCEPSSGTRCTGQPSSSSPRQSTSWEVCRSVPQGSHHPRNQAQGSRSSFSGHTQHDQVDQQLQGPTMAPQQYSLQGNALMPSTPPALSGYPAQPYFQAQPFVQAPTVFIMHSWSGYPPFLGPSQTWYPQYSMPGMPYGPSIQPPHNQ